VSVGGVTESAACAMVTAIRRQQVMRGRLARRDIRPYAVSCGAVSVGELVRRGEAIVRNRDGGIHAGIAPYPAAFEQDRTW
jgi:hypothetical protein